MSIGRMDHSPAAHHPPAYSPTSHVLNSSYVLSCQDRIPSSEDGPLPRSIAPRGAQHRLRDVGDGWWVVSGGWWRTYHQHITNISPTYHQHIATTSPTNRQNIVMTSLIAKRSPTHDQHVALTAPLRGQTSPGNCQNIARTPLTHHHHHTANTWPLTYRHDIW